MRTGFEPDHVPVHTVPAVVHNGAMPVNVPSSKCRGTSIRVRQPLSEDAVIFWETDPRVEAISHYPVEIKWSRTRRDGSIKEMKHNIEFAIRWKGGRRTYIDVEKVSHHDETWFQLRTQAMKYRVPRQLDAMYTVISEKVLHGRPLLYNRRHIYSHLHVRDERAKARIRWLVTELTPPMTIAALSEAAVLRRVGYRMLDPGGRPFTEPLRDVDRAYTAIMQLAAAGELRIDQCREITDQSLVTWKQRSI
ncbi:hypothetical protein GGQ64_003846 [Rhizobium azooxidifex]|uniref:TnsA endonuclease N-terminal domain-containing protein n=1 Tax=Mycoplana azooxidifex TaxID=1636188 RepID=A0A7W6DCB9_9HYPH|nr:hypothetical protein [Mycoplana azooxidifex]MBB3978611.1 hypothetical protein [Mycoplana azooxidifex]